MKHAFKILIFFQFIVCAMAFSEPPPNPSPPPFIGNYLPIVLVNKSGLPDDQVYIVMTGREATGANRQVFLEFASSGVGSLVVAAPGDNSLNHSRTLSQLPKTKDGAVIYLPYLNSGAIFFSIKQPLNMPVNAPNAIVQPNFTNPADPNYNIIFDLFEITYPATGRNISANMTAVTFFGIPLYGYLSTPEDNMNTGLYEPRASVFQKAAKLFSYTPDKEQWNGLFLKNGTTILRLLSPGKAMTAAIPIMDPNYLDNEAVYGYSFIRDIWTGPNSFYRRRPLRMKIPAGSLETYTGVINPDNTITFTSAPSGYKVVFAAPRTRGTTTTQLIFSGLPLHISDTSGRGDGIQLSKLFEEAIIAGLVPTPNTLSNEYLIANQSKYYKVNYFLSHEGKITGPWYDLYSRILHSLGPIYTFAYDEPLWPHVQLSCGRFIPNQTYFGITIAPFSNP